MRRLDAERENLVAAAEWGEAETRQRIAGALWRFWLARGAVAEGRRLVEAALAAGPASATAAARAHNAAGILAGAAGDHDAARAAFGAALEHVDDRTREARVITNLGVLDVFASDYDAARARYGAATEIYRELGDVRGQSIVTQNLAIAHELSGDADGAVPLLEESVGLARAAGDPAHVASTLHVLGSLLARRGDVDRAVPLVLESLELGRGENALTVECLETLARVVDPVTGATLLGAAEAQREATGAVRQPDEQPAVDELVAALQAALNPDALEVALERGRRTELAAAVELAMAAARSRSA
jgi:tetratricopeptide (TPR) repeat protein